MREGEEGKTRGGLVLGTKEQAEVVYTEQARTKKWGVN